MNNTSSAPPMVLYIMGTGRSGTTILEVVLTNNASISGVGEVTHIFRDAVVRNEACSCQRSARDCPVWGPLISELGWTDQKAVAFDGLFRRVEQHSRFPLTWLGAQSSSTMAKYRAENVALFSRSAAMSGAPVTVDSSKYAARALALDQAMPGRVAVIWLVRSPQGVLAAFSKPNKEEQKPKRPFSAMLYYMYVMFCAWLVKRRLGRAVLVISYEEFLSSPKEVLTRIENWSGLDLGESKRKIDDNEILAVYHIVTGNRLRKQKDLRFRVGVSEHETKGFESRFACWVMSAWNRLLNVPKFLRESEPRC